MIFAAVGIIFEVFYITSVELKHVQIKHETTYLKENIKLHHQRVL